MEVVVVMWTMDERYPGWLTVLISSNPLGGREQAEVDVNRDS